MPTIFFICYRNQAGTGVVRLLNEERCSPEFPLADFNGTSPVDLLEACRIETENSLKYLFTTLDTQSPTPYGPAFITARFHNEITNEDEEAYRALERIEKSPVLLSRYYTTLLLMMEAQKQGAYEDLKEPVYGGSITNRLNS